MRIGFLDTAGDAAQFAAQMPSFGLEPLADPNLCLSADVDGLVLCGDGYSDELVVEILKGGKHVLLLDAEHALGLLTPDMVNLAEETGVELSVAGPKVNVSIFNFIDENIHSPYYVRVVSESSEIEAITFQRMYQSIYWNAYFTDVEFGKMKINALPAVSKEGVVLYGRTEAGASIPVDIWCSNLAFADAYYLKIFAQDRIAEVDCLSGDCKLKGKSYHKSLPLQKPSGDYRVAYVESFLATISQKQNHHALNVPAWQFMRLAEFYRNAMLQVNL